MARVISRGEIWAYAFRAPHKSAVNLDHVQTVEQSRLVGRLGHLGPAKMRDVCRAMAVAAGCAD